MGQAHSAHPWPLAPVYPSALRRRPPSGEIGTHCPKSQRRIIAGLRSASPNCLRQLRKPVQLCAIALVPEISASCPLPGAACRAKALQAFKG